jgi:mannose-1-phosphate guanylyltransferase
MRVGSNRWALILAAGSGTRLSSLTRADRGASVPKQFCSLAGGPSLLEETLARADALVGSERTFVVVAADQRRHWESALRDLPQNDIVVQPRNRGTAIGILLGAATALVRDPDAVLVMLPSDHFVEQEAVLGRAIKRALSSIGPESNGITFIGVEPEHADPELGYILRGSRVGDGGHRIAAFVEKPSRAVALELLERDALWNSFILVARARAFVDLIGQRYPEETESMLKVVHEDGRDRQSMLEQIYEELPEIDFSRHVVEGAQALLTVVPALECGWNDLGTPERLADCLERLDLRRRPRRTAHLSLAEAHSRWALAAAPASR